MHRLQINNLQRKVEQVELSPCSTLFVINPSEMQAVIKTAEVEQGNMEAIYKG
ncbi:MAG: hypothetical protein ACD_79C00152G0002 [uncultured bacterium]|nr:MAG: hypothetical protein ACD_79C00152G0002 [uncultured bacterium]